MGAPIKNTQSICAGGGVMESAGIFEESNPSPVAGRACRLHPVAPHPALRGRGPAPLGPGGEGKR